MRMGLNSISAQEVLNNLDLETLEIFLNFLVKKKKLLELLLT